MNDYVKHKYDGKYILPTTVYLSTLWIIRDYYRLKEMVDNTILQSQSHDDMPKGTDTTDPTARKASKISSYMDRIRAIDKSIEMVPEEYRKGVWDNVMHRTRFPQDAARETYSRYKSMFVCEVAHRLDIS